MKEERREQLMRLQMLDQYIKQMEQNLENIEQQFQELGYMGQWLDQLKDIQKGSDVLFPIANGMFAKGKISDTHELLVNVGSNVVVPKSIEDSKKMLQEQSEELVNIRDNIMQQLTELVNQARQLQQGMQDV